MLLALRSCGCAPASNGSRSATSPPAAANIFSVTPGTSLALTSAEISKAGVKQLLWGNRAEWTFAAYDITRHNVYVQTSPTTFDLAGEIVTKATNCPRRRIQSMA
jgi:iron complex outermembrane receptor protein